MYPYKSDEAANLSDLTNCCLTGRQNDQSPFSST